MTILAATRTVYFLGTCTPCKRPVRAGDDRAPGRYARLTCPECGKTVTGERLHATINADPCHGACMGAAGPSCSCSCAGANHGRVWQYESEATETALDAYRARIAKQEADAEARRQATANARRTAFQTWAEQDDNAEVVAYLADARTFDSFGDNPNDFLYEMAQHVNRHQQLTERQAAAVIRCRDAHRRIEANRAEDAANARPVPTGDAVSITGTIIYAECKDNPYGSGVRLFMLVKGDGWKVWSTIPKSILPAVTTVEWRNELKGRRVQFTANVEAKPGTPNEGTAKRPRKATLIDDGSPTVTDAASITQHTDPSTT